MIYFSLPLYDLEKVSRSNPKTLDLVPTVSNLKRSVVSLGYKEEKDFVFKNDLGMLNVSKSDRIVMIESRSRSHLYQMVGSIMSEEVEVIALVMEDQSRVQSMQIG